MSERVLCIIVALISQFGVGEKMKKRLDKKASQFSVVYLILAINFCSIFLLSCFNYVVFHRNSKNLYTKNFLEYKEKVMQQSFHNIDKQIRQMVYNIPKQYFSQTKQNAALLKPQEENIEGNAEDIQELTNRLRFIHSAYPDMESFDVYYENTGVVVTGFSNVHFLNGEEFTSYLPWYEAFKKQEKMLGFLKADKSAYPLQKTVLSYIRAVEEPRWNGKKIIVAIHINPSIFFNYLDSQEGCFEVRSSDGEKLYQSGSCGSKKTVFTYSSPTTSLSYTYSIENAVLYADVNSQNRIFSFTFIFSIVFNILLLGVISYYSGQIYRKRLVKLSQKAGVPISEKSRSFDDSLKHLQGELLTMHSIANSSKVFRFQSAVRALLLNKKAQEENILENHLKYDRCRVLLIENGTKHYSVEQLQELADMREKKADCNILFTTMGKEELIVILNFRQAEEGNVFEETLEYLKECIGMCRIAVGIPVPANSKEIYKAYITVCEIKRYWFIFREKELLFQEELQIASRKNTGSHLRLFEVMEKNLNSENFMEFKLHLEMLITSFKNGMYSIDYCYDTLRDLVTLIYQISQYRNLDMWVVYGYDLRKYYKQIPDIETFQIWVNDACEILLKNVLQKRKNIDEDGDLKDKLTMLIEENLENMISLDFLSDKLSMRPDVLSRTFKQVMGEGYTEYVKKEKLKRAIQLLEAEYSVKDIAQKLGYSSSQYFIKIFKEVYGTTPYQYKKNKQTKQ